MRTLLNIITLLLIASCTGTVISGPAVIYNGAYVKALKDQFKLNNTANIMTGTADPSSVAQDAPKGSLYLRQGAVGAAYVKQDDGSSTNWQLTPTVGTLDAEDVLFPSISGATDTDTYAYLSSMNSAGIIYPEFDGNITSNGDGTAAIALGRAILKTTNDHDGGIVTLDFAAVASLALTDNSMNYIVLDYNAGTPQITASTSDTSNRHSIILMGQVYRAGTTLHVNEAVRVYIAGFQDHSWEYHAKVSGYSVESGGMISETGTNNFAVTAGKFWYGMDHFNTASFDSSGADTFTYYYRDGVGGWTSVASQSAIDNTKYDDGSGTLATLTGTRKGVHWEYMEPDGDVSVVYGRGSYTTTESNDAQPPADLPPVLQSDNAFIIGKIRIQNGASSLFSVQTVFATNFSTSAATDHNDLSALQGGTATEYYHTTSAQHAALVGLGNNFAVTSDGSGNLASSAVTATELGYASGVTSAIQTQLDAKANDTLSDLASPTAVNQHITADGPTRTLGTTAIPWSTIYGTNLDFYTSGGATQAQLFGSSGAYFKFNVTDPAAELNLSTIADNTGGTFITGDITAVTGDLNHATSTNRTGHIELTTGDGAGNADSGDIAFETGTAAGTGVRGSINVLDGSEGTAGYIFTSKDNSGSGEWARPPTGEVNYITNDNGRFDTSGWAEETSGQLDITQTSTAADLPREATTATGLKFIGTGSTGTNKYVKFAFTLDDADVSKKLKIEWDQKIISGYVAGEFDVVIYDVTNTTEITPSVADIHDGTHFLSSFDATTSLSYELRIRKPLAAASSGIVISNVIVGPGKIVTGAIVGEWEDSTSNADLTYSGTASTNATVTSKYRQIGTSAEIQYEVNFSGAANANGDMYFTLPDDLTVDTSSLANGSYNTIGYAVGYFNSKLYHGIARLTASGSIQIAQSVDAGAASGEFYWEGSTTAGNNNPANVAILSADSMNLYVVGLPIAEWSGSGTSNYGAADVEYYSYDLYAENTTPSAGTTYNTQSYVSRSPAGSTFSAIASTTDNSSTLIAIDIPGGNQETDKYTLEYKKSDGAWTVFSGFDNVQAFSLEHLRSFGLGYYTTATQVIIQFGNGGRAKGGSTFDSNGATWAGISNSSSHVWRIVRSRSGVAVGFGQATATESGLVKAEKQYYDSNTTAGGTVAITFDGTSLVVTRGTFIPYQTYDGAWRLKFNLHCTHSSDQFINYTIAGVTFKTATNLRQPVNAYQGQDNTTSSKAATNAGGGDGIIVYAAAASGMTNTGISGDVELDSKPTWAD